MEQRWRVLGEGRLELTGFVVDGERGACVGSLAGKLLTKLRCGGLKMFGRAKKHVILTCTSCATALGARRA